MRGQRHAETKNFRKIRIGFRLETKGFVMHFYVCVIEYCGFRIRKTVPYTTEKKSEIIDVVLNGFH